MKDPNFQILKNNFEIYWIFWNNKRIIYHLSNLYKNSTIPKSLKLKLFLPSTFILMIKKEA